MLELVELLLQEISLVNTFPIHAYSEPLSLFGLFHELLLLIAR